eukprot:766286-Hanusia_phi.AAC.2
MEEVEVESQDSIGLHSPSPISKYSRSSMRRDADPSLHLSSETRFTPRRLNGELSRSVQPWTTFTSRQEDGPSGFKAVSSRAQSETLDSTIPRAQSYSLSLHAKTSDAQTHNDRKRSVMLNSPNLSQPADMHKEDQVLDFAGDPQQLSDVRSCISRLQQRIASLDASTCSLQYENLMLKAAIDTADAGVTHLIVGAQTFRLSLDRNLDISKLNSNDILERFERGCSQRRAIIPPNSAYHKCVAALQSSEDLDVAAPLFRNIVDLTLSMIDCQSLLTEQHAQVGILQAQNDEWSKEYWLANETIASCILKLDEQVHYIESRIGADLQIVEGANRTKKVYEQHNLSLHTSIEEGKIF